MVKTSFFKTVQMATLELIWCWATTPKIPLLLESYSISSILIMISPLSASNVTRIKFMRTIVDFFLSVGNIDKLEMNRLGATTNSNCMESLNEKKISCYGSSILSIFSPLVLRGVKVKSSKIKT